VGLKLTEIPDAEKVFIDANIFLYSAFDHPIFGRNCRDLLTRVENKEVRGFSSDYVLGEVFHKLTVAEISSVYGVEVRKAKKLFKDRPEIIDELKIVWVEMELIKNFNLGLLEGSLFPDFVVLSRRYSLMAADAIHLSMMRLNEVTNIATNNNDFERVEGITQWKP
jgi:predicted nucleic acid-binding protein